VHYCVVYSFVFRVILTKILQIISIKDTQLSVS
jgi:hypothetical protein